MQKNTYSGEKGDYTGGGGRITGLRRIKKKEKTIIIINLGGKRKEILSGNWGWGGGGKSKPPNIQEETIPRRIVRQEKYSFIFERKMRIPAKRKRT